MPTKLVVATGNAGKLREFRALLGDAPCELLGLRDVPEVELPEEGCDYEANAVAKARAVAEQAGLAAIGDDSGLEVDALGGAPGPLSARFGGPGLDDPGRVRHLLAEMQASGKTTRGARFVCWIALATPDGEATAVRGACEGAILASPRGDGGFGYDPIFQPEGHACSMAELAASEKDRISHRGRALQALVQTSSWERLLAT